MPSVDPSSPFSGDPHYLLDMNHSQIEQRIESACQKFGFTASMPSRK